MNTENKRTFAEIALDIRREWVKISPYAKPYLDALRTMWTKNKKDCYGFDSAEDIALRFLANASGFRGERAKALKTELKALL